MADPERSVAEQQRHPRSTEAPGGEPEVVRLWLLGAFEVSVGHRSIGEKEWRLKKAGSLLSMTRLLALTGVAGSGKTRLALEVARDLLGAYPDGVWLVELALLSVPALTPQAVAAALGVREQAGRALAPAPGCPASGLAKRTRGRWGGFAASWRGYRWP